MASHPETRSSRGGNPANPKGRPRGSRNFSTDLKATLKEPIRVTNYGKAQTVSTQQAALMRLREKALSGDVRALDSLIGLARFYNDDDEMAEAATRLSATDAEILEAHDAKVLRQAGTVQKQSGTRKAPGHAPGVTTQRVVLLQKRMTTMTSYNELDAILRSDLSLFVREVFATVSPNRCLQAQLAHRGHRPRADALPCRREPAAADHAAAPLPQVDLRLGRIPCLGAGP